MELCSCWLHPLIDDFHLPLGQRYINILHSCLPSPSVVTAAHQQSEASSVAAATAASSRFLGASQLPREHPGICGILWPVYVCLLPGECLHNHPQVAQLNSFVSSFSSSNSFRHSTVPQIHFPLGTHASIIVLWALFNL